MDISWTWLGIVVLALIIFACASGFRRGFVKEIVSAFFMIISFLLVWAINPYVNTFGEPRTLKAVAYQKDRKLGEYELSTAKSVTKLKVCRVTENERNIASVSYTHLDVYKRQGKDSS